MSGYDLNLVQYILKAFASFSLLEQAYISLHHYARQELGFILNGIPHQQLCRHITVVMT